MTKTFERRIANGKTFVSVRDDETSRNSASEARGVESRPALLSIRLFLH